MTTLESFVDKCWDDHAADPSGVAERVRQALSLVRDQDGLVRVALLVHHVLGEHLGRWEQGLEILHGLAALGVQGESSEAVLKRCKASLRLCAGASDDRLAMTPGEACRVTAMAACNLSQYDSRRSARYMEEAATAADGFPNDEPAVRAVASLANNIAATLQDRRPLDDQGRRLMIRAAELARTQWERAGTWKEIERAEYRLAVCWVAANDGTRALEHANLCSRIVEANGSEPLEAFFAAEAKALASHLLRHQEDLEEALATAESSFAELEPADQAWCLSTLETLRAHGGKPVAG